MEFNSYGWYGKVISGKNPRVELRRNLSGKLPGKAYITGCEALIKVYPKVDQLGKMAVTLSMNSTAILTCQDLLEMADVIQEAANRLATVI